MAAFFLFIEIRSLNFVFERKDETHGLATLMAYVIKRAEIQKPSGFPR